jgi:uncharacterized integral membrane protein
MATLYLACFIALLTAAFALQNTTPVTVRFLFWQYDSSLLLVIVGAVTLGVLMAFLLAIAPVLRRARQFQYLSTTVASQGARIRRLQGEPSEPTRQETTLEQSTHPRPQ